METKHGINIYNFSDDSDKIKIKSLLNELIHLKNLVPVIGSGFTCGLRTKFGSVPSATELQGYMISLLCKMTKCDKDDYQGVTLSEISDEFWKECEKSENGKYVGQFKDYMEKNFTRVFDMEQSRCAFLRARWQTIFTLNYDDAIEQILKIATVIPYTRISNIENRELLIKLHGDAAKYALTGDKKYCILGKQQYVELIRDEQNQDIIRAVDEAFFAKSILFVGCGLGDELDILYSSDGQLAKKATTNKKHHIIYLNYEKEEKDRPSAVKLSNYGITDIIRVNSETIAEFYELVCQLSEENQKLREADLLKKHTDIQFEFLDDRNPQNIDYLFYNDRVKIQNGTIKLPSYFVEREVGKEMIENVRHRKHTVNLLCGTSFSGKTYVLLQLLRALSEYKVYYFPSEVSLGAEIFPELLKKENSVVLIDDKALTYDEYMDSIVSHLEDFEKRNITIVLVINKADYDFYRYFAENKSLVGDRIKFYELANKLNEKERLVFNKKIGILSLKDYHKDDTILDYIFKVEKNILEKKKLLPQVNFLDNTKEKEVRALIVLTTKGTITSRMALELGIDEALYNMADQFQITVQKDYLSSIERMDTLAPSGFKFVLNSSYWAIRCLSNFAQRAKNHKTISKAYSNIMSCYRQADKKVVNTQIKTYCMLDKIQMLFSDNQHKGTIKIPYVIYEELHSMLNSYYDFLHQEVKCELRVAKRENSEVERSNILELAYRNIYRAIDLAGQSKAKNVEYTIAHMNVTRALVLTNYVQDGHDDKISETISAYYDVYVKYITFIPHLKREEIEDIKKFLGKIVEGKIKLDEVSRSKFNDLYSSYFIHHMESDM